MVRAWKATNKEVFLPLSHPPGEAQVDFGLAQVTIAGKTEKVAFFVMTLPYSDAIFCQVFPRECTEVFLEGHKRAFEYFGGVPRKIRYDNLKIAVSKILGSRERQLSSEFDRLRSHYLFQEEFCLVRRPMRRVTSRTCWLCSAELPGFLCRTSTTWPNSTNDSCIVVGKTSSGRCAASRPPRRNSFWKTSRRCSVCRWKSSKRVGSSQQVSIPSLGQVRYERLFGSDEVRSPEGDGDRDRR